MRRVQDGLLPHVGIGQDRHRRRDQESVSQAGVAIPSRQESRERTSQQEVRGNQQRVRSAFQRRKKEDLRSIRRRRIETTPTRRRSKCCTRHLLLLLRWIRIRKATRRTANPHRRRCGSGTGMHARRPVPRKNDASQSRQRRLPNRKRNPKVQLQTKSGHPTNGTRDVPTIHHRTMRTMSQRRPGT